jgi:hypothetical protein
LPGIWGSTVFHPKQQLVVSPIVERVRMMEWLDFIVSLLWEYLASYATVED